MSEQLQLRAGTAAQVAAFTGASAECVVDTTNNRIVVNDGSTVGGWAAAKLVETITNARTAVSDAAYTALTTDRMIAYTALSAARVVSLPSAAAYPTGTRLLVVDESGAASPSTAITVTPNGTDSINGVNAAVQIASSYGFLGLESNQAGEWTITDGVASQQVLAQSRHGAQSVYNIVEYPVSGMSGASVTVSGIVPTDCVVLAVGVRVTTAITGATSFSVGWNGPGGSSSTFGSGLGVSSGSTNYGLIGPTANYTPAANITLTAAGGSFTAGAVRLSIHYLSFSPPTS